MAVKQTAGRNQLGGFAPEFARLNDDVLFGEVWSREDKLSLRDRSLVTVVALMAQGLTDSSFKYHLLSAKNNGITKTEIAEILTHAAFYAGWPKAWAAFRMATEVWAGDNDGSAKPVEAILRRFPPRRSAFSMSPLSRAAATTGMSTMPIRAADRSSCVLPVGAIIRSGASPLVSCTRAMS